MTPKKLQLIILSAILAWPSLSIASELFYEVERLYQKQDFHQIIDTLDEMKIIKKADRAQAQYFRGLALKGMGDYQAAAEAYRKAIRLGLKRSDIYYEYGQALYADNNLENAQKAFKKSISLKFQIETSQYYIAYIYQLLEQYKEAKKAYIKVIKGQNTNKELLQIANFQLAEVLFSLANPRENPQRLVKRYVLPQFKKALELDPDSRLAKDIRKRELEVRRRFGLDPNTLINGRYISPKRHQLTLSQAFSYDSNITQATDLVSVQTTDQDSYVMTTNAKAAYTFVFKQRYLIKPELKGRVVRHTNRDEPRVFRNDTWSLTPALRSSLEHRVNQRPANFFVDYEYGYVERDPNTDKDLSFYARYHQLSIGEKFRLFDFGDTTIKAQRRDYDAFSSNLSSTSTNIGIDQLAILPNKHVLLGFFLASYIRSDQPLNELNYYLLRFDYLIPEFFPKYTLHLTAGFSFLDTPDPAVDRTRGLEIEYNPAVKIIKKVTKNFTVSIGHNYTKRSSDDKNLRVYSKHVSELELKYNF